MSSTSGLICLVFLALSASAQFNPRFQPQFAPPPQYQNQPPFQRSMSAFAEFNGFGVPQIPSFGPRPSNPNRMSSYPPQAPYGSPLFGTPNQASSPFGIPNQLNELALMEQQMFGPAPGFNGPISSSQIGRRPSFAQFGGNQLPPHLGGALPPAFANLPPSYGNPIMSPVGGRPPFQRVAGQEVNAGSSNFNELEPFQQLPTDPTETKEKRSIKTE